MCFFQHQIPFRSHYQTPNVLTYVLQHRLQVYPSLSATFYFSRVTSVATCKNPIASETIQPRAFKRIDLKLMQKETAQYIPTHTQGRCKSIEGNIMGKTIPIVKDVP